MRKVAHPNQSLIGPQGHKKGPWGHFSHWPQGPFLWPCGPIFQNPLGGEYPSQSGHKAVEKALGATFCTGPKGLFYDLVARFSRILLVGRLGGKGHKAIEKSLKLGHFIKCNVVQKIDHSPVGCGWSCFNIARNRGH